MTLKVCISIEALKTDVRWNMRTWKKGTGYNFFLSLSDSQISVCSTFRRVSNDQITLLPCKWCNGHKFYDTKYHFIWCGILYIRVRPTHRDHYDSDKWSTSLNNYPVSESWLLQAAGPSPAEPPPLWRQRHYSGPGQFTGQCYKCSETHCFKFATLAPPSHSLIYAKNIF